MITIYQCYSKNKFPFNIFAILIKFFSKTNYSHYALSYISETGKEVFFDSTGMGVRRMTAERFFKKYEIKKGFKIGKEIPRIEFINFVQYNEGKSYGFIQVIGLLLKILNIVKKNPFGKGNKYIICNELVILFLNWFNFTTIKDTDSLDLNDTEKVLMRVL